MTGDELRNEIKSKGCTLKEIADELGVSAQNLNSRLSVKSVKQEFMAKVLEALEKKTGLTAYQKNFFGKNEITDLMSKDNSDKVRQLEERIVLLEKLLEEKERTIQILMKGK